MVRVLGHRQTKEAATDNPSLPPPRHIPTLPDPACGSKLPVLLKNTFPGRQRFRRRASMRPTFGHGQRGRRNSSQHAGTSSKLATPSAHSILEPPNALEFFETERDLSAARSPGFNNCPLRMTWTISP